MTARPRIDPADYLTALEWDGTPRLDRWLVHVLGESPESLGDLRHEYLSLVGRFWLLGMVYRAMEPGCPFSFVPVLVGAPGTAKSTLVEVLAGPGGMGDAPLDLHRTRDVAEQLQGLWLYELTELQALGRQLDQLKALVTARSDAFRPAYGQGMQTSPRRVVFVGTTQAADFLPPHLQDRRFWPIVVPRSLNAAWVHKWRDQLFAEAYGQWRQNAPCHPSPEQEARVFRPALLCDVTQTALYGHLLEVLGREPVDYGPGAIVNRQTEFVTMSQLCTALGLDPARSNARLEQQLRHALDELGWQRAKRHLAGDMQAWGYVRPAAAADDGEAVSLRAPRAPDAGFRIERSEQPGTQSAGSVQSTPPTAAIPATDLQTRPPRFVRHARSLFRLLGFELAWVPPGDLDGTEGASLVISRVRAQRAGGAE